MLLYYTSILILLLLFYFETSENSKDNRIILLTFSFFVEYTLLFPFYPSIENTDITVHQFILTFYFLRFS